MTQKPTKEDLERSIAAALGMTPGEELQQPEIAAAVILPIEPRIAAVVPMVAAVPQVQKTSGPGNIATAISPRFRKPLANTTLIKDAVDHDLAFRMAFLGSGQGGGRIANSFYGLGYRRVGVFNTTNMDFEGINGNIERFCLEIGGAAKDMTQSASALKGNEEAIRDLLLRSWGSEVDYGIICVSLGGGTGGGSCNTLVDVARRYLRDTSGHERVGAIVSLPPVSEGYQVARNAVQSFRVLTDLQVSPLVIIDNARIHELYRPGVSKLHALANESVSTMFDLFNQLAAVKSPLITFDQSELGQLLDHGLVVMGAAHIADDLSQITNPSQISGAIRDELTNNVLAKVDLRTGLKGACLFVGDNEILDNLDIDYFDAGFTQLDRLLGTADGKQQQTILHRGVYPGSSPGLQVYTMISELQLPRERLHELAVKGGLFSPGGPRSKIADWLGL